MEPVIFRLPLGGNGAGTAMAGEPGEDHLHYYLKELDYLRGSGAEFARRYPRVAGRLDLGDEGWPTRRSSG